MLYFESGTQSWVIGNLANGYTTRYGTSFRVKAILTRQLPTLLAQSQQHATNGANAIALGYTRTSSTDNAIFLVEGTWDLSGTTGITFDPLAHREWQKDQGQISQSGEHDKLSCGESYDTIHQTTCCMDGLLHESFFRLLRSSSRPCL